MKSNEFIRITKIVCNYIKATLIIIRIGIITSNIVKYEKKKQKLTAKMMITTGIIAKLHQKGKGNENKQM